MKNYLAILVSLISLSSFSAEDFEALCESPEAVKLKGAEGTCKVVINLQDLEKEKTKTCYGTLYEVVPCVISFKVGPTGSTMAIACVNSSLQHVTKSNGEAYTVSAIVTSEDGKEHLILDPKSYLSVKSKVAQILYSEETVNGKTVAEAQMAIADAADNLIPLSDIQCE